MEGDTSEPTTPPPEKEEYVDWVRRYNQLVEEAQAIGLEGVRPIRSHFRDHDTGARRCQALESSIKARKEGLLAAEKQEAASPEAEATEPEGNHQETETMTTATKRTARKAVAKRPAKAKTGLPRGGVLGDFDPLEGSKLEKLVKLFAENKNKWVDIGDMLKAVYGSKDTTNRSALSGVIKGVEVKIEDGLRSKYKLEREGRGEETKYKLSTK